MLREIKNILTARELGIITLEEALELIGEQHVSNETPQERREREKAERLAELEQIKEDSKRVADDVSDVANNLRRSIEADERRNNK